MTEKEIEDDYSILKFKNNDETDLDWKSYVNKNTKISDKSNTKNNIDKENIKKRSFLENKKNISYKRFKEAFENEKNTISDDILDKNRNFLNISSLTKMIENDKTNIYQKKDGQPFVLKNVNFLNPNDTSEIFDVEKNSKLLYSHDKPKILISDIKNKGVYLNSIDQNNLCENNQNMKSKLEIVDNANILTFDQDEKNVINSILEPLNTHNMSLSRDCTAQKQINNNSLEKLQTNKLHNFDNYKHKKDENYIIENIGSPKTVTNKTIEETCLSNDEINFDKKLFISDLNVHVKKEKFNLEDTHVEKSSQNKEDLEKSQINQSFLRNLNTADTSILKNILQENIDEYKDQTLKQIKYKLNHEINKYNDQKQHNDIENFLIDKNYDLLVQQYNTKLKNEKEYKKQIDTLNKIIVLRNLEISCLKEKEVPKNNVLKYVHEGKKILFNLRSFCESKEKSMNQAFKEEIEKNEKLVAEINSLKEIIHKLLDKIKKMNN